MQTYDCTNKKYNFNNLTVLLLLNTYKHCILSFNQVNLLNIMMLPVNNNNNISSKHIYIFSAKFTLKKLILLLLLLLN